MHRYLGTRAWLSSHGFYFNNSVLNFWRLNREKFFDKFRMSSRETQVDASRCVFYRVQVCSDALSALEKFSGDLFFRRQYSGRSIEIDIDVSSLDFLYDAADYFSFFGSIFIDDGCAFRFADF